MPTSIHIFGSSVERDVVDIEAVVVRVDTPIFRISPLEGVITSSDGECLFAPTTSTSIVSHLLAINIKVTIIITIFRGNSAEEAHFTVSRNVQRHSHVAHHIGNACATALHAILPFIRVSCRNSPRIIRINLPIILTKVTCFEKFLNGISPNHFNIRTPWIHHIRIIFSPYRANRIYRNTKTSHQCSVSHYIKGKRGIRGNFLTIFLPIYKLVSFIGCCRQRTSLPLLVGTSTAYCTALCGISYGSNVPHTRSGFLNVGEHIPTVRILISIQRTARH